MSDLRPYIYRAAESKDEFKAFGLRTYFPVFDATSPTDVIAAPGVGRRIVLGAIVLSGTSADQIRFFEGNSEIFSLDGQAGLANAYPIPAPLTENAALRAKTVFAGSTAMTIFYGVRPL